jgi:ABC-type transporter Mla MlaB component
VEALSQFWLESHPQGATLYVRGALSVCAALRALDRCAELPPRVRALRVDLRGVRFFDPSALDAVAHLLGRWRAERTGVTRVKLPRERTFVSPPSETVGLSAARGTTRGRGPAAVTDSLHDCTSADTGRGHRHR